MTTFDREVTLFPVRCAGCGRFSLGGTGRTDDPLLDVTYQDAMFVCSSCYRTDKKRAYN